MNTTQSNIQTVAQANVPFSTGGNPNTIYNMPPRGGYLPPVSNAYDEWRINPFQAQTFGGPAGAFSAAPFPQIQLPTTTGGGFNPPVLPPVGPPSTTTPQPAGTLPSGNAPGGLLFPVGGAGWMLGGNVGPQSILRGNGSLNTSYAGPFAGMGISGLGFSGAPTSGSSGTIGFNFPSLTGAGGSGINRTLGNILDLFLPGDAFQNGHFNAQNLGLGVVDQVTGLPVTWGLDRLAHTDWAQSSDSAMGRWLREWSGINDADVLYGNMPAQAPTGWLAGVFDYLNQQPNGGITVDNSPGLSEAAYAALDAAIRNMGTNPADIYARQGVAGFIGRINPATGRAYTPAEINNISRAGGGNPGVGLRAAGAGGSRFADVLQGDAARSAFESMALSQLMTPTFQYVDAAN